MKIHLFRSMRLAYKESGIVNGIPAFRYVAPKTLFANGTEYPPNEGFCPCRVSGIQNLSNCAQGGSFLLPPPLSSFPLPAPSINIRRPLTSLERVTFLLDWPNSSVENRLHSVRRNRPQVCKIRLHTAGQDGLSSLVWQRSLRICQEEWLANELHEALSSETVRG